jgi:hypothetical protein
VEEGDEACSIYLVDVIDLHDFIRGNAADGDGDLVSTAEGDLSDCERALCRGRQKRATRRRKSCFMAR